MFPSTHCDTVSKHPPPQKKAFKSTREKTKELGRPAVLKTFSKVDGALLVRAPHERQRASASERASGFFPGRVAREDTRGGVRVARAEVLGDRKGPQVLPMIGLPRSSSISVSSGVRGAFEDPLGR